MPLVPRDNAIDFVNKTSGHEINSNMQGELGQNSKNIGEICRELRTTFASEKKKGGESEHIIAHYSKLNPLNPKIKI